MNSVHASLEIEQMIDYWTRMTPGRRAIFAVRVAYMLSRKSKIIVAFTVAALAVLIGYGVTHDPLVLGMGILVGIILGIVMIWR